MACSVPAGNGGTNRGPETAWVPSTRSGVDRPGSASSGRGIRAFFVLKNMQMP